MDMLIQDQIVECAGNNSSGSVSSSLCRLFHIPVP